MAVSNLNSIQAIKSYFQRHNGLQLSNRFDISFSGLPNVILPNGNNIEIQSQAITLSPRSINTIQDNLIGYGGGRFVPRSQNILPGPGVMVQFPVTNDNYILQFFDNWFNYIYAGPRANNNYNNPFVLQYYDDAVFNCTMYIRLLDPNGEPNTVFTFYEVFPVEIQPLELNMMKPDNYLSCIVTFGFREFVQNIF